MEGILSQAPLVSQLFIHGESTEDKLVAVVVLDEEAVKMWRAQSVSKVSKSVLNTVSNDSKNTSLNTSSNTYSNTPPQTSSDTSSDTYNTSSNTTMNNYNTSSNTSSNTSEVEVVSEVVSELEVAILEQMNETGRRSGLKGYELVYAGKNYNLY